MKSLKFRRGIRLLLAITLIPIIVIGTTIYQTYNELEQTKYSLRKVMTEIHQTEWASIKAIIDENTAKAQLQANTTKGELSNKLFINYGNNLEQLRHDLRVNEHNKAHEILQEVTSYKFLNKKNEDNRIILADERGIIADSSLSASLKANRTWEEESNNRLNPILYKDSVEKILHQKASYAIIESTFYERTHIGEPMKILDIDDIKTMYLENGMDVLKSYNIIVPSYLTDHGDIFGVPDINPDGTHNNNHKITIIQEFNLYDSIFPYSNLLDQYTSVRNVCKEIHDRHVSDLINRLILNLAIMVLTFIALICSVMVFFKLGDEEDARNNHLGS